MSVTRFLAVAVLALGWVGGTGLGLMNRAVGDEPFKIATEPKPAAATLDSLWTDLGSREEGRSERAVTALCANPNQTLPFLKARLKPVKVDPQRVAQLIADLGSDKFVVWGRASVELQYLGKYVKTDLEKVVAEGKSLEGSARAKELLAMLPGAAPLPNKDAAPTGPIGQPREAAGLEGGQAGGGQAAQGGSAPGGPGGGGAPGGAPGAGGAGGAHGATGAPGAPGAPGGVAGDDFTAHKPVAPAQPAGPPVLWLRAARAIKVLERIGNPEAQELLQTLATGEADALPTIEAKAALERLKKDDNPKP